MFDLPYEYVVAVKTYHHGKNLRYFIETTVETLYVISGFDSVQAKCDVSSTHLEYLSVKQIYFASDQVSNGQKVSKGHSTVNKCELC